MAITITEEQKSRLIQIIEDGDKGRNITSLETMHEQYNALLSWVDSFEEQVPKTSGLFQRDEIYRNLPINVERQLAEAFKAIGKGDFRPSAYVALGLFSQVGFRNRERYGVLRP